jgi:hypothetical protein
MGETLCARWLVMASPKSCSARCPAPGEKVYITQRRAYEKEPRVERGAQY